ncbi:hypothetical protein NDU88_001644 [Pleurodeles waltl]|uniref:Uncharacterized protein n=1 Tax=Pleurodeles waltl TaxID=8319 RepID=A0AAV7LDS9_PLEWA|nr:hypothetical protein NDU88_001644 [Pleurodeles waltl]
MSLRVFRPLGAFRRNTASSHTGGRRESGDWSTSTATPAEHRPQNYDPHFCVAVFCWRSSVGGHVPMAPVASRRTNAQVPGKEFPGPDSAYRHGSHGGSRTPETAAVSRVMIPLAVLGRPPDRSAQTPARRS